jgi:hypothetical protein
LEILKKRYKAMKNAGTKIYNEKKNEAIWFSIYKSFERFN